MKNRIRPPVRPYCKSRLQFKKKKMTATGTDWIVVVSETLGPGNTQVIEPKQVGRTTKYRKRKEKTSEPGSVSKSEKVELEPESGMNTTTAKADTRLRTEFTEKAMFHDESEKENEKEMEIVEQTADNEKGNEKGNEKENKVVEQVKENENENKVVEKVKKTDQAGCVAVIDCGNIVEQKVVNEREDPGQEDEDESRNRARTMDITNSTKATISDSVLKRSSTTAQKAKLGKRAKVTMEQTTGDPNSLEDDPEENPEPTPITTEVFYSIGWSRTCRTKKRPEI